MRIARIITPLTCTSPEPFRRCISLLFMCFLTGCGIDVELVPGSSKTTVHDGPALTAIHHIALVRFDLSALQGGEANDQTVGASAVRTSYMAKLNEVMKSQEFSGLALSQESVDNSQAYLAYQKVHPPLDGEINGRTAAEICDILGVDALLRVSAFFDTKAEVNLNALVVSTSAQLIDRAGKSLWEYGSTDKLGVNVGNIPRSVIDETTESATKRLMRSLVKDIRHQ